MKLDKKNEIQGLINNLEDKGRDPLLWFQITFPGGRETMWANRAELEENWWMICLQKQEFANEHPTEFSESNSGHRNNGKNLSWER